MLKYTFHDFPFGNYCLVVELHNTKIMIGSFFNENTIINLNNQNKSDTSGEFSLFTSSQETIIKNTFLDLDIVIITNFSSMLGLPYMLLKYNISTENIKFLSTEPIIQLAKSYMKEFYSNFNSFIIEHTSNSLQEQIKLITSNDIDVFMALFTVLSYNQRFNSLIKEIDPSIIIFFTSSGYELGSFNIVIEYFNKSICILSNSSITPNRYPLDFNYTQLTSMDYVIQFPHIINGTPQLSHFEKNLSQFIHDITAIFSKSTVNSTHYPYIFLIAEPFFMFEFVDILRYKLPKEVKCIYISKSIDSLMKYSLINLSFINEKSYRKIYDFMSPLSFDELQNREAIYTFNTFEEMISNEKVSKMILKAECPIMFIVNKMSFEIEENSVDNLFQFFTNNSIESGGNDYVITLNYSNERIMLNKDIKQKNYIIDYNITKEEYQKAMQILKPIQLQVMLNDKDKYDSIINYDALLAGVNYSSYELNKGIIINFALDDLVYSNSFSISEIKENYDIALDCHRENVRLFLSKVKKSSLTSEGGISNLQNKEENIIDQFEEKFKQYLECNEMTIVEFLYKENMIKISISKSSDKQKESFAEIEIIINDDEPIIDISTENYNNSLYLNTILNNMLF